MISIRHADLLRSIESYVNVLTERKIAFSDFFIESTYKDGSGKKNKKYNITKMGCELYKN